LPADVSMTYDSGVLRYQPLCLTLAAIVGLLPAVPPEHAHEVETDGHLRIVVHQHSRLHAIGHVPVEHHSTVDHPDEPILTFSAVFTAPPAQIAGVPVRTVVAAIQPLDVDAREVSVGFVERLIHGPPRAPSGLRAPPAILA
jgi:hypothetical protein